jgi:hypothetical protein
LPSTRLAAGADRSRILPARTHLQHRSVRTSPRMYSGARRFAPGRRSRSIMRGRHSPSGRSRIRRRSSPRFACREASGWAKHGRAVLRPYECNWCLDTSKGHGMPCPYRFRRYRGSVEPRESRRDAGSCRPPHLPRRPAALIAETRGGEACRLAPRPGREPRLARARRPACLRTSRHERCFAPANAPGMLTLRGATASRIPTDSRGPKRQVDQNR